MLVSRQELTHTCKKLLGAELLLKTIEQSSDRDNALEAGFHEHMVKPVDIAVLQSLFEKIT